MVQSNDKVGGDVKVTTSGQRRKSVTAENSQLSSGDVLCLVLTTQQ